MSGVDINRIESAVYGALEEAIREEANKIRGERGIPELVSYEKNPELLERAIEVVDAMQTQAEMFEAELKEFINGMLHLLSEYAAYAWVKYCAGSVCEDGGSGYVVHILEAIHDLYRAFERLDKLLFEERNTIEGKRELLESERWGERA